jgi:lysine 2,3-aminomutase
MDTEARAPQKLPVIGTAKAPSMPPPAKKPPADPSTMAHRNLLQGEFWRRIPAYADVTEEQFLDHNWQAKSSITRVDKLLAALQGLVDETFIRDADRGLPQGADERARIARTCSR